MPLACLSRLGKQYAWGAVVLGGTSARLIGASAAVFHGLADPRLPTQLAVDSTSGLASRRRMTVVRQRPEARPSRFLASPPRTVVEDTVMDMCAAAANEAAVIGFLTLSIPRLTSPGKLRRALERRVRIAHRSLISDISPRPRTGFKVRWSTAGSSRSSGLIDYLSPPALTDCLLGRWLTARTRNSASYSIGWAALSRWRASLSRLAPRQLDQRGRMVDPALWLA
jgi:hypothetical protein